MIKAAKDWMLHKKTDLVLLGCRSEVAASIIITAFLYLGEAA